MTGGVSEHCEGQPRRGWAFASNADQIKISEIQEMAIWAGFGSIVGVAEKMIWTFARTMSSSSL